MTSKNRSEFSLTVYAGCAKVTPLPIGGAGVDRCLEVDVKKLMTLVLVLVTASLGFPSVGFAQTRTSTSLGTISGETVDAGGRALVNQRVELLRDSEVLNSTTSGSRGEWSFSNVAAGEYVVRTVINGKVAGARVSVTPGQMIARAMIVAPSASAPAPAFLGALGLLGGLVLGGVIAAIVITTIVIKTKS